MILNWYYYIFVIGAIHLDPAHTNDKKTLLPELVNSIVENEIASKLPRGAKGTEKKGSKRSRLTGTSATSFLDMLSPLGGSSPGAMKLFQKGSHMKAATDAINKLVDESIVNRVEEAEKEVSQMLLRNIEHHIQDAGKIFKGGDEKTGTLSSAFDRNVCRDKLDSCAALSQAGVCKTSRDAMRENCRHTCNYCHVMLDHDMQAKLAHELENHEDGGDKVLTIKFRHKGKKHKKHHLATDEVGMLGNDMKMHEPELEKPEIQDAHNRDEDDQAKELERIKGEANKLLAAQRKIKQEKLADKERHEAEKLLETEKKIKEEEQREMDFTKQHHQKKKKKKKGVVHKPASKGTSSFISDRHENKIDEDAIPFLNEDPYPLTDFVTEYDKTVAYGRNAVLKGKHATMDENSINRNTKDRTYLKLDDDVESEDEPGTKKYTNTHSNSRVENTDYKVDGNLLNRNSAHHPLLRQATNTQVEDKRHLNIPPYDKLDDTDDNYDDDKHESNNLVRTTYDDTHLPMLNEKDAILGSGTRHHIRLVGDDRLTALRNDYRKMYIDTKNILSKPKIKNDVQNMIDKAFGEVLETD